MLRKTFAILSIALFSLAFVGLTLQSEAALPVQTTPEPITFFDQVNQYFNQYLEFTKTPESKSLLMGMLITPPVVLFLSYPGLPFYSIFWYKRIKHKHPWGLIYDEFLKDPLAFAPIHLYQNNISIDKQYSDIDGKYSFIAEPGSYVIKVDLFGYPKKEIAVEISERGSSPMLDIPISQPNNIFVKGGIAISKATRSWVTLLISALLTCGIILSASAVRAEATYSNYIIVVMFAVEFILTLLFQNKRIRSRNWGIIYDTKSKIPLKGILVRLWDINLQILHKVQITDYTGRYGFKVSPGKYALMVHAPKYIIPATSEFTPGFQKTTNGLSYMPFEIKQDEGINLSIPAEEVA